MGVSSGSETPFPYSICPFLGVYTMYTPTSGRDLCPKNDQKLDTNSTRTVGFPQDRTEHWPERASYDVILGADVVYLEDRSCCESYLG